MPLAEEIEPVWTFSHPSMTPEEILVAEGSTNRFRGSGRKSRNFRHAKLTFTSSVHGVLHGFAGYFDCVLYKDIVMSILPDHRHSAGMFSWFPIFFPLLQPLLVSAGQEIAIGLWR